MKIKFVKNQQVESPSNELIFNFSLDNSESNIKTDIENLWKIFGSHKLTNVVEDFLLIGIAVFSVDKVVSRNNAKDNWGRSICIKIPVLEFEKWIDNKSILEESLAFLTGDTWKIEFYHTEEKFNMHNQLEFELTNSIKFDSVSLFSGGIDSFCGALKLLKENYNPIFVGFKEYPLLIERQISLFESIKSNYSQQKIDLLQFYVSPTIPEFPIDSVEYGESSSRSRSFLFIAGAITVASLIGKSVPVYIPENGFIGVNVPLTQSRIGSCSTRTTHPYFLSLINHLLNEVGIKHEIINFYSTKTKGEIIAENKNNIVFKNRYMDTLSCSHPVQSRYNKVSPPINCGYCYPCLIRKSSLIVNGFTDNHYNPEYKLNKGFLETNISEDGIASDLRALLYSIRRYIDNKNNSIRIRGLLRRQGRLSIDELNSYERVYRNTLEDLISMIEYEDNENSSNLKGFIGI